MAKRDYICSTRDDALKWISAKSGDVPERLPISSITEYFSCGGEIYALRYNKRQKTYEVLTKTLKQGRYLTFYDNSTRTAIKSGTGGNDSKTTDITCKWITAYRIYFNRLVEKLMTYGVPQEFVKDYAQDAFLKICNIDASTNYHFYCIWFNRTFYDWKNDCSLKATTHRCSYVDDGIQASINIEMDLSKLLKNERQAHIIKLMSQGFSITDISETTGQSFATIFCLKQRAFKELKKKLVKDYENR